MRALCPRRVACRADLWRSVIGTCIDQPARGVCCQEVAMTHAEAVAILKGPREPGAEGYRRYAAACTEVYINHMARKHPDTFTTDEAKPMPKSVLQMSDQEFDALLDRKFGPKQTQDADRGDVDWAARLRAAETRDQPSPSGMAGYSFETPEQSEMGNRKGGVRPVGATLVQRLPGPASAYFIGIDDTTGSAALYRSSDIEGRQEMSKGGAVVHDELRKFARLREATDRAARSLASTVRSFWTKQNAA
jgi:hypothetical protein